VVARAPGGRLTKAEISREPGAFVALGAVDGVGDGAVETWVGVLPPAGTSREGKSGELLVRVVDAAGNSATQRIEIK
jgi:hypothetical protein